MTLLERIEHNVTSTPDKIILSDEKGDYSYRQMWQVSGQVYAYLLQQEIGQEDVVLIHLPRGAEAVMAMVGVFRTGAAVVILEDWGANAWVDFVRQDVKPRITINDETMKIIRQMQPADGYITPDLHDLAYIAYTTGTTGESKGVMHEYGTIERYIICDNELSKQFDLCSDRIALITTLHTSIITICLNLVFGTYTDFVPHRIFDDPNLFHQRLIEKRITYTYLSPLYLNKYGLMDTPDMRYIAVSFEPINNIYSGDVLIFNDYGMRETGSAVCEFVVDKPYDITPIGKPLPTFHISILDENDQPVPDGVLGEICVDNTYCRGYLNLPEVTKEHFRNGLYHTHDLGKLMPDGNYIMYGRMNDALKTPNGLIIALEIEVEARKVLGRASAYVKLFPTEHEPVICLYTDFPIEFQSVQNELRKVLPAYKVPTDHVQVEQFEYNNGKAIRVHLKNPRQ